tara:strand:- start:100 stop:1086 length:987 start_codon:yes stop_codon:yes gene_type:complete
MIHLLPYALAAYGGYQGYKGAKDSGASGLGRLFGAATGAYGGYTLGTTGISAFGSPATQSAFIRSQPAFLKSGLFPQVKQTVAPMPRDLPQVKMGGTPPVADKGGSLSDLLLRREGEGGKMEYDPLKISALAAGVPFALGAFDQGPVDIYTPGYNMGYLKMAEQRGNYKYIDPDTGQEKEYETIYKPEEQGRGQRQIGPYSYDIQRLRTGGIAEIKKFNEGGVNYLPSKTTHDENDSNNYVRAAGYVEDGAGVGDKDEDTMLAQLADGEFVTRADGVLGAGIIAGANPNSFKDMREKGAQYFYEQQRRYKRVFDLLKEKNGYSQQKTN